MKRVERLRERDFCSPFHFFVFFTHFYLPLSQRPRSAPVASAPASARPLSTRLLLFFLLFPLYRLLGLG